MKPNPLYISTAVAMVAVALFAGQANAQITVGGQPNPAFADLKGWWDASDESTFTFSAGTEVATWTDKSTAANVGTTSAAAGITRDSYLNGTSTVTFTGAGIFNLAAPVILTMGPDGEASAFVVSKTTDASGGDTVMSTSANVQIFSPEQQRGSFLQRHGWWRPAHRQRAGHLDR